MTLYRGLVPVFLFVLSSCGDRPCDTTLMLNVIERQIRYDGRSPDEYDVALLRREGEKVYIEMSLKMSPPYRRHYILDVKSCKILDLMIDQ